MNNYPIKVPALKVDQPIGVYYVVVLTAEILLDVAYSDVLSATKSNINLGYDLAGTQRLSQPKRLSVISDYINRVDSAFPNSIILAANFRTEDGFIEDEDEDEDEDDFIEDQNYNKIRKKQVIWSVNFDEKTNSYYLIIPTKEKLAAIIDGQHRLFAFAAKNVNPQRLKMGLICSIFLDLPKPYQAQLFATINSTQKPVDKSLTYELFGYNIDEENSEYWTPDKLAVFLTRKLSTDDDSPLRGRIIISPKKDSELMKLTEYSAWKVSTAVVVEGIMRLFTSNPKKDGTNLLQNNKKRREEIRSLRSDRSPLRKLYLENQDNVIYLMTLNFFKACEELFWREAKEGSFIIKTIGVQALFDILRKLSVQAFEDRNISYDYFCNKLKPAAKIDFTDIKFKNASGSGRSIIRKSIEEELNYV